MAFLESFIELRNGGAAIDTQEAIEKVVSAVRATGKAGKVTIELSIKPASKDADCDVVFVKDTIKTSVPKPDTKETIFYINRDNQLTRHDERQMSMLEGVKEVLNVPKTQVREIR